MSLLKFSKELVANQLLGVGPLRRLVDSISSRPSLAPQERDPNDIWSDPFHPELALRKFRRIQSLLGDPAWIRGKVIAEIGPGMSFGMGIVALALGARRSVLVDREQYVTHDARGAAAHRALLDLIPSWIPDADPRYRTCMHIDGDAVVPDGRTLLYAIAPAERLPLADGSVDLLVSHSTLEHIRHLDAAVAEFARITAPGGKNVHQVDLSDHLDPANPLRMLGLSARAWDLIASHRRGWTNRLRLSQYLALFERYGLQVQQVDVDRQLTQEEMPRLRSQLHHDYRGLADSDLQALGFYCVLQRL